MKQTSLFGDPGRSRVDRAADTVKLGPPTRPMAASWFIEQRRAWERFERFAQLLQHPAYVARLEAAAAELRACRGCHGPKPPTAPREEPSEAQLLARGP